MRVRTNSTTVLVGSVVALWLFVTGAVLIVKAQTQRVREPDVDRPIAQHARQMLEEGREVFRRDTFGNEAFWGDTLKLHQAIQGATFGGVGGGVSPKTALSVGLKVDAEALPANVVAAIKGGQVNLDDPATLTLLRSDAVVGVRGVFNEDGSSLKSVGITCGLCHSTVDDSFSAGIGRRLDGWANRDLNVGAIIGLSPDLSAVNTLLGVSDETTRKVLASWGPGKFDALLFLDGKAFQPDGRSAATLIPPAFGLAGVNLHGWNGFGSVTYWNAFVANLEMHGVGRFFDPRLNDPQKYPVAAKAGFGNVANTVDLVSAKLPALHSYQLALPPPPPGSYDASAARRGEVVFNTGNGKQSCATCPVPPIFTEPGWNMRTGKEIGIDEFQASRSPGRFINGKEVGGYRTSPLKGLWSHQKGGFFHDGRFATLREVVDHYDTFFNLGLNDAQERDLVEYLKSI